MFYFNNFFLIVIVTLGLLLLVKKLLDLSDMLEKVILEHQEVVRLIIQCGKIPSECIKLAFEAAGKLKLQCAAFDFIQYNRKWFIVEVSYAFNHPLYYKCEGLWDQSLSLEKTAVIPEELIIKYMLLES